MAIGELGEGVREPIPSSHRIVAAFACEIRIPGRTLYPALGKGLRNTTLTTMAPVCSALGIDLIEVANENLSFATQRSSPALEARTKALTQLHTPHPRS